MNLWKNRNWQPMLLKEVNKPFNNKNYIFELKYDGIRATCFVNKNTIEFRSRNNTNLTQLFPELINIKNSVNKDVIFDGEIVAFNNDLPNFSKIQERLHLKDSNKIKMMSQTNPVVYIVFDILYENKNLIEKPLLERKIILNKYQDEENFIKSKYIDAEGKELFKNIKKMDLEGIVAKNKLGLYHINKRTNDFIKIKNIKRDEFLIGGYVENKVNISIYLCHKEQNSYNFVGKCSVSKKNELFDILKKEKKTKNFMDNQYENIFYIRPKISCYIEYTEKTKSGNLRHPVYKGIHYEK